MGGARGCYCVGGIGHDSAAENCGAYCRDAALLWRGTAAGPPPCRKADGGEMEQRGAEVANRLCDRLITGVCGAGCGARSQRRMRRVSGGLRDCEDREFCYYGISSKNPGFSVRGLKTDIFRGCGI